MELDSLEGANQSQGRIKEMTSMERELKKTYHKILFQEELHWKQKFCNNWLKYGDHNIIFFKMKTMKCRSRNNIIRIQDDDGSIIEDESIIKDKII